MLQMFISGVIAAIGIVAVSYPVNMATHRIAIQATEITALRQRVEALEKSVQMAPAKPQMK